MDGTLNIVDSSFKTIIIDNNQKLVILYFLYEFQKFQIMKVSREPDLGGNITGEIRFFQQKIVFNFRQNFLSRYPNIDP